MKRRLLPYQGRWVADEAQLKVIEKSRRIGLSWAEAYEAVMHAGGDSGNVYYQSYDQEMTRGFIDDCAEWAGFLKVAVSAVGEMLIDDGPRSVQAFRLALGNGREIVAMTSAPRAFRSKGRPGDLGIVDEAAFVDDLEEVLKAALAFLVWGGRIHVLSTHDGESNPFNKLCEDIRSGTQRGSLHTGHLRRRLGRRPSRARVLEVQGRPPSREAMEEWARGIRHVYRHNAAEELDCIPAAGAGTFLGWELIRKCRHADAGSRSSTGEVSATSASTSRAAGTSGWRLPSRWSGTCFGHGKWKSCGTSGFRSSGRWFAGWCASSGASVSASTRPAWARVCSSSSRTITGRSGSKGSC